MAPWAAAIRAALPILYVPFLLFSYLSIKIIHLLKQIPAKRVDDIFYLTEELPIYRATYRLLNMLIRATQDFPRYYKYSLGTRMVDVCLDMSILLYKANSSYEKVELIKEFLSKFSILQMLLRVCAEQKVIDTKKVAVFALEMEKIGKQATGWKQYNEKGRVNNENKR